MRQIPHRPWSRSAAGSPRTAGVPSVVTSRSEVQREIDRQLFGGEIRTVYVSSGSRHARRWAEFATVEQSFDTRRQGAAIRVRVHSARSRRRLLDFAAMLTPHPRPVTACGLALMCHPPCLIRAVECFLQRNQGGGRRPGDIRGRERPGALISRRPARSPLLAGLRRCRSRMAALMAQ